ncbi:bidirectional sugar transporter SWEET4 [Ricinus communis]|uniref:Bidirectional sugar transporter SWEET n=1 Tax=Ricinus communis TaxID=3988 RepID=B9T3G8_RICCO|nr:bidirectional sugar transporter SWEET4 [Ricinus communis]EEF29606.1 conserved hypothetical protein [Ricinus communis]|eukprot:XP_002532787.1 bidirectional sugar transporter SWEET4 [Ricinus communis]
MVSASAEFAHAVVGSIGNVISLILYLSPMPTFCHIYNQKDVEEFQCYPYVAAVMNCLLLIFQGLPMVAPSANSPFIFIINGLGLAVELLYLHIFRYYEKKHKGFSRVVLFLAAEVILLAIIVTAALLGFHTHSNRNLFVGIFCAVSNVVMYGSPLAIMKKVVLTRSVEYMPHDLSLASFFNGVFWTVYAVIIFDPLTLASNGLGALLSLAQLLLYAYYSNPKRTAAVMPVQLEPVI